VTATPAARRRRRRRTKAQLDAIRGAIYGALEVNQPMTVRQVFYVLTSAGVILKLEREYGTVKRLLAEMRRDGTVAYEWVADATRWMRKPTTYGSVEEALHSWAQAYRRDLWRDGPEYVEVWCEKDALAGVLAEITDPWDVPLMVTRGYASISYLHSAAKTIYERTTQGKHTTLYYFGDHDPSGRDIDRAIRQGIGESLRALEMAAVRTADRDADGVPNWLPSRWLWGMDEDDEDATEAEQAFEYYATFERIAVTPQQITAWKLPTRPTKGDDPRSDGFRGASVELDAIPPAKLRQLAEQVIDRHVDHQRLQVLRVAEEEERKGLERLAARGLTDLGPQNREAS
jgi:hypothetical protein